jgi:hypothetical protein
MIICKKLQSFRWAQYGLIEELGVSSGARSLAEAEGVLDGVCASDGSGFVSRLLRLRNEEECLKKKPL